MEHSHVEQLVWSGDLARLYSESANKDTVITELKTDRDMWRKLAIGTRDRLVLIKELLTDETPRQAMLVVLAALTDFEQVNDATNNTVVRPANGVHEDAV